MRYRDIILRDDVALGGLCCDGSVNARPNLARWVDPAVALGLFGIGVILYLVELYQLGTGPTGVHLGVRIGLLAVACAADVFRRKLPAIALGVGGVVLVADLFLGPTVPIWLVVSDLVYAAVLYGATRTSKAVCYSTAIATVVFAAAVYVATGDVRFAAGSGLVTALFFGTPVWWALTIRRQLEITAAERERATAQQALADADREAAVAHERATMARDLHDVIASHLSSIAIHSEAALSSNATRDDPNLHTVLSAIRTSSVAGLSEMRSMIELLRSDYGGKDPLAAPPRLAELHVVVDAARATGCDVSAHVDVDTATLPSVVDHTAYRIVQEALTNAIKHVPGAPIGLSIRVDGPELQLCVRNPVRSESLSPVTVGHGLANMRHRAELLGGSLEASVVAGDWVVGARLPTKGVDLERRADR